MHSEKLRFSKLNSRERTRLVGVLRVAIEVYTNDAVKLQDTSGHERMAGEFTTYAHECEELLEELES